MGMGWRALRLQITLAQNCQGRFLGYKPGFRQSHRLEAGPQAQVPTWCHAQNFTWTKEPTHRFSEHKMAFEGKACKRKCLNELRAEPDIEKKTRKWKYFFTVWDVRSPTQLCFLATTTVQINTTWMKMTLKVVSEELHWNAWRHEDLQHLRVSWSPQMPLAYWCCSQICSHARSALSSLWPEPYQ